MSRQSDDSYWAWSEDTLARVGFLWGSDLAEKLAPHIAAQVEVLHPKPNRWWWHTLSTFLLVLGFTLGVFPELEQLSVFLGWGWIASILAHSYVAFQGWKARTLEKEKTEQILRQFLSEQLVLARQHHLSNGPFTSNAAAPPPPEPLGVSHEGAEHLCGKWLAYLGESNVRVTRSKNDGGIDIESSACVAQVKNYQGSVGVPEIRELVGVASVDGRYPVFFTSGTYTKTAVEFANQAGVYLFKYDAVEGTLDGLNKLGLQALESGLVPQVALEPQRDTSPIFTGAHEMQRKLGLMRLFVEWAPFDPARTFATDYLEHWERIVAVSTELGELDLESLAGEGIDKPYLTFSRLWDEFEAAARSFGVALGVDLPSGESFSEDSWSSVIKREMISDGKGRRIGGHYVYDLIRSSDKAAWWNGQRESRRLAQWFSTTANSANSERKSRGLESDVFWAEIVEMNPQIQSWVDNVENGDGPLHDGLILQAKFKGLLSAWAQNNGIALDAVYGAASSETRDVSESLSTEMAFNRTSKAPAHCPNCDYAPAPEELKCSECGLDFS